MAISVTPAAGVVPALNVFYDYRKSVQLQDDFVTGGSTAGNAGALGWNFAGGSWAQQTSEAGAPGIARRNTTAASGTTSYVTLNNAKQDLFTAGSVDLLWRVRLNTNDANTTVRVGMGYLVNTTPTDGQYFEKLDADTNWFAVTRASSTQTGTRTDTGVAVGTGFILFRVVRTASSIIQYFVDNVLVATHTTNIPSQAMTPAVQIINSAAADKTIDLEYFQMTYSVSR